MDPPPQEHSNQKKGAWTGKGLWAPEGCPGVNMSPQIHVYLEPPNETSPGNRVFADVINYAEVSPNPIMPINSEHSLEGLMKQKLQSFGQLIGKDPDAGKDRGQEEKGVMECETIGWHHQLNGHEFEQAPGDSEGQGSLGGSSPWGHKESDTTTTTLISHT